MRSILCVIGGVILLQVPLFIALSKLAELKALNNTKAISLAQAGQAFLIGSLNITGPSLTVDTAPPDISTGPSLTVDIAPPDISRGAAFKPLSYAHYPFVLFSGYRLTLRTFYVHGSTSVIVRRYENDRPVYRCEWVPAGESTSGDTGGDSSGGFSGTGGLEWPSYSSEDAIVTEARMLYVSVDENGMAYVGVVVNCTFNRTVGANGAGGLLRLHLSRGPNARDPHHAVADVFREKPGDVNEKTRPWLMQLERADDSPWSFATPEEPLYKYAFCGPPLYGRTHNLDWVRTWLAYHHFLWEGKAHFFFYVAEGLDPSTRDMLDQWIRAGLLTVIDGLGGDAYPSWYRNQLLFINDCLSRTRFIARWTFFHDLDELLFVPSPNTLAGLLEKHNEKPWMTFGNWIFSTDHCKETVKLSAQRRPSGGECQLERFLWRKKQPECLHENEDPWMCLAALGRRKVVVNPRKVFLSGVHRVALPEEGGINFNVSVARMHHFHGITYPWKEVCDYLVNMESAASERPDPRLLDLDDAMASMMPQVREFAGPLLLPPL